MQISKVPQPDDSTETVYQVEDEGTFQGVFYLAVDREAKTLTLYSIDPNGAADQADSYLLASRIGIEGAEETEGGFEWTYGSDEDLTAMLADVVGEHVEILTRDMGLPDADPAAFDASLADAGTPEDGEVPNSVDVADMEFEFDPGLTAGDTGPGGANDANLDPGAELGGGAGDVDVNAEPAPGEIDLENPVPPDEEEEDEDK